MVVEACSTKEVPHTCAVVEMLRNSDRLPVGILVPLTLVTGGRIFQVRIDNVSTFGFVLRPNTRISVLRDVDTVLSDRSQDLDFQVSTNEIHVCNIASHPESEGLASHPVLERRII